MITVRTSPAYVNRVRQDWTANGGVYGDGGVYAVVPSNDPFAQLGPTLDLTFAGNAGNLSGADTYTLDTNFITPQYQIAAQYAVWVDGSGMTQRNFADIVTFTRGSNATQFDSTGSLVYAPVNLLTYSEDFGNAAWTKSQASVSTNVTLAPDGTTTADKLTENTAASTQHRTFRTVSSTLNQLPYTFSVYAKADTRTRVYIAIVEGTSFVRQGNAVFDLSAGTIVSASTGGGGATGGSASIAAMGNGWYRCSYTLTLGGTDSTIFCDLDLVQSGTTITYTGDGTSGLFIWGAQLNPTPILGGITSSLTTYYPTTTTAYYGPRFDFDPSTLAAQGLLIEEQRTNSIRNNTMQGAVAGTPGTLPTNWTIFGSGIGTLTQQVVGTGTSNGISYIDYRVSGTTSTTNFVLSFEQSAQIVAANGQTWADSAWVALIGGSTTNITTLNLGMDGRTAAGAFVATVNNLSLLGVTPTLTRYTSSGTIANASIERVVLGVAFGFASGVAIDITLRIGLPQLEQGAFATSVIPTTTTALTRNADQASVNSLSPWYNQVSGTMFAEFSSFGTPANFPTVWQLDDGTAQNNLIGYVFTNVLGAAQRTLNVSQGDLNTVGAAINAANTTKMGYAYATNDSALSGNGSALTGTAIDNTVSIPTVTTLRLGAKVTPVNVLNGYLRRITYYPRRLANADLQTITA